jgi:hypothetical protein
MKTDAVRASVDRIRQSCDEDLMKEKERIMSQIEEPVARRRLFEPDSTYKLCIETKIFDYH